MNASRVVRLGLPLALVSLSACGGSPSTDTPASSPQTQTTWFVDVHGSPPGSGTQDDPYTSIQYAISRPTTSNGHTLLVAPGTYLERIDFLGKNIRVASTSGAESTVIQGQPPDSVVLFIHGEGPAAMLIGFTITQGLSGPMPPPVYSGGGVGCGDSSPTLVDLVVQHNSATYGGGMAFVGSGARVLQCTIQDNSAGEGAGVYVYCSSPTFEACTIRHNVGLPPLGNSEGGGVYGTGHFHNCWISENSAAIGGGVYYDSNCLVVPMLLEGCTIKDNFVTPSNVNTGRGGGVYGPATLVNCTITGNRGCVRGGGAYKCTLTGCEIANNICEGAPFLPEAQGGGAWDSVLLDCSVHDNAATVDPAFAPSLGGGVGHGTATRCRIWNNTADKGAGVLGTALWSCTIFGNTASVAGGAFTSSTVATIRNSILWGNLPDEIAPGPPQPIVIYSDVSAGYPGMGNIMSDPMLWAPLAGDFHLDAGSPCIAMGDPAESNPDGSHIDIGAYSSNINYCGPFGTYCSAKVNSAGCSPSIGWTGTPTLSGADDFFVTVQHELNQRSGFMIWSLTAASQITLGGVLCVHAFKRTPPQTSGGTSLPVIDCSGTYSYFFSHAYMNAQGIVVGTTVYAQYYGRDPFIPDGTGASLSNALEFTVCP